MKFHLYGLIVGLAIVVGWGIAEKLEPRVRRGAPWIILWGIVGARAYHIVDMWSYYSQNLGQILALWNGGLGIYGGMMGGMLGLWIYYKGEFLKVMAAVVTGLPLAQAIGRIGNGVNGEFITKVIILPWWGAEAILDLILFGVMWTLRGRTPRSRVGVYLIGYGVIRFWLEFWRVDKWMWGGLGVAQWIAMASSVIGLWIWRSSVVD